jgi:hypothetical protein
MKSAAMFSSGARKFITGCVVVNAGILMSLLFGANSGRPNPILAALGLGVVVIGLILLAVAAMRNRRPRSGPGDGQ